MQAKDLIVTGASRLLGKLKCLGDISASGKVTATNGFEGNVVGNISGSAGTAGEFTSAKSVTLTGDVTGTASSKGGWSIATTVADDSHNHTASTINVPKMTKSYTGVIGTENNADNGSFYFIKVAPTTYNGSWTITYTIDASMSGVSDANGGGRYHGEVYIAGMRNTYSVYYIRNEHSNTSYRPIYYHELYRAKEAGATTYGHALGVGLRNAYGPANSTYARSITVKILDYSGCTITLLDTPVKYASWTGKGSTNYDGLTSFDAYTQGIRMVGDNNDTTTLQYSTVKLTAGTNGLPGYSITMMKPNGTWEGLTVGNASTGTTSTKNTSGFVLGQIYLYWSSTNIAAGAQTGTSVIRTAQDWIDLRYTTNCGTTLTAYKMVYIKGTMSGGLFYLADTWWVQDLPTTNDGFVYIPIGMCYGNGYSASFWGWHGAYVHNGTTIVEYNAVAPEVFVVNFTSASGNTYTADKTYSEITAAYNAGKIVYGKDPYRVYILSYGNNGYVFQSLGFESTEEGFLDSYYIYYTNNVWTSGVYDFLNFPTLNLSGNTIQLKQNNVTISTVDVPWLAGTETITWSGSGSDKTASPVIDCTTKDLYIKIPYISGASQLSSTATDGGDVLAVRCRLYSDANKTNFVGYYKFETGEISSSNSWTWASVACVKFGKKTLVAPHGYYVQLYTSNTASAFNSNSQCTTYLNTYATEAFLVI